jgi:hypothetical protein
MGRGQTKERWGGGPINYPTGTPLPLMPVFETQKWNNDTHYIKKNSSEIHLF